MGILSTIVGDLATVDQTKIGILPDEVAFWSRQLSEHALFLCLGLEEPSLKDEAFSLHQEWEDFRVGNSDRDVLSLCDDLRGFKSMVLEQLNAGNWCGWLYPSFVDHTRRELDLFVAHLKSGGLDPNELCEWLRFMAEHAAFAAHLLDPTETQKVREATETAGKFNNLVAGCNGVTSSLISLSQKAGDGLDAWLKKSGLGTSATKSVVHPVLAAHVVREGERFLQTTEALKAR